MVNASCRSVDADCSTGAIDITNAVTHKLTGELRYQARWVKRDNDVVEYEVYDTITGEVVHTGNSRSIAQAVWENMNGLDLEP